MKFVTIRDFRNKTAEVRKALDDEHEIVLTVNGRPFALLTDVDEDTFEEKLSVLRRARSREVLDRIRAGAAARGVDKLTMDQIDAIVAETRRERRARK